MWPRQLITLCLVLSSCRAKDDARSHERTDAEVLDQTLTSPNGLVTVHYPAEFSASPIPNGGMIVTHRLPSGQDEFLTFVSSETVATNDLQAFVRATSPRQATGLNEYVEKSRRTATCNGLPGVEVTGVWITKIGRVPVRRLVCYFLANGHGYAFSYSAPDAEADAQYPRLRRIREAARLER